MQKTWHAECGVLMTVMHHAFAPSFISYYAQRNRRENSPFILYSPVDILYSDIVVVNDSFNCCFRGKATESTDFYVVKGWSG